MKKVNIIISIVFFVNALFAQQGKDGSPSITSTVTVNAYTALTASVSAGGTSITVASAAGISQGDLLFIIQMQGATVNADVNEWGNVNTSWTGTAQTIDTGFGKILSYNGAGNNEFAQVTSISGNVITIDCGLKYDYRADNTKDNAGSYGKTQVIRVPRYTSLTLSGSGQITCQAWN